ncbi:MAG: TetR/AcrR family transcriptional regulator [Candidatus Muiribacteriota bacterium]
MVKATFQNLPENKKNKVINAGIKEFSAYVFHKASITRICKRSQIPKGSFYQYFYNKKDLYLYIFDLIVETKMKSFNGVLDDKNKFGFFENIKRIQKKGIEFAWENPDYIKITQNMSSSLELTNEILKRYGKIQDDFFSCIINAGIKNGDLKNNLDVKILKFIVNNFIQSVQTYVLSIIKQEKDIDLNNLDRVYDDFFEVLKNGIGVKKGGK